MDEQGVEQCFLFPTLGDCVEGLMMDDPEVGHKAFHAYNLWLEDDWGYGYKGRLWSPPYIPMLDPELAADELEFVVNRGAKIVSVRPGPAAGRSPADPVFDRFWSIANEAKTFVAYHAYGGHTVYDDTFKSTVRPGALQRQVLLRRSSATRSVPPAASRRRSPPWCSATCSAGSRTSGSARSRWGCSGSPPTLHAVDHAGGIIARQVQAWGMTVNDLPSDILESARLRVALPRGGRDRPDGDDRRRPGAVRLRLAPPRGQHHARRLRRVHPEARSCRRQEDHAGKRPRADQPLDGTTLFPGERGISTSIWVRVRCQSDANPDVFLPHAVDVPLLTNEERLRFGGAYARRAAAGRFFAGAARFLAATLVLSTAFLALVVVRLAAVDTLSPVDATLRRFFPLRTERSSLDTALPKRFNSLLSPFNASLASESARLEDVFLVATS